MARSTYEATIKVLATRERVDPRISPGATNGDLQRAEISEEEFNSELEIIRNREVVEAVVKELGLDREPDKPAGRWEPLRKLYRNLFQLRETSPLERAVTQVSANLEAVSVRKPSATNSNSASRHCKHNLLRSPKRSKPAPCRAM